MKEKFAQPSKSVKMFCEHEILQNFLLLFMSLLTALIVKNSHILAGIYFLFLKKRPRPNLKGILIPNMELSEKISKLVTKQEKL